MLAHRSLLLISTYKPQNKQQTAVAFEPYEYLKRSCQGLSWLVTKEKRVWELHFPQKRRPPGSSGCSDGKVLYFFHAIQIMLMTTTAQHTWFQYRELQVPQKWLPISFTGSVQVSKDIVTEMLHLPLLFLTFKSDDCSKYLQKTLPAGTAGKQNVNANQRM